MRKDFESIPDLDSKHNDIHRKAYSTPYLLRRDSAYPGSDDLDENEMICVMNSSTSALCIKVNSSTVLSAGLT